MSKNLVSRSQSMSGLGQVSKEVKISDIGKDIVDEEAISEEVENKLFEEKDSSFDDNIEAQLIDKTASKEADRMFSNILGKNNVVNSKKNKKRNKFFKQKSEVFKKKVAEENNFSGIEDMQKLLAELKGPEKKELEVEDIKKEETKEDKIEESKLIPVEKSEEKKELYTNGYSYIVTSDPYKIRTFDLKYISKKQIKIYFDVRNPDLLYNRSDFVRVVHVDREHPIFFKINEKIKEDFRFNYLNRGSFNGELFKEALIKIYAGRESYFSENPCFKVIHKTGEYKIVLTDIILDYNNTAYYVLAEIEISKFNVVEINNFILINVDIIFSN